MFFTVMFLFDGEVFEHVSQQKGYTFDCSVLYRMVHILPSSSFEYHLCALQDLSCEPESEPAPLLVVVVPALPKGAAVELHVTAVQDDSTKRTSCQMITKVACGVIECNSVMSADSCSASLSLSLTTPTNNLEVTSVKDVTEAVGATVREAMKKMDAELVPLCARVFYKCTHTAAQQVVIGKSLDMYSFYQDITYEALLISIFTVVKEELF